MVVCSSCDVTDIIRGRISVGQFAKNLASTLTSVGGGSAGWVGGAALGTIVMPGVGSVVGGLIGSMGVGAAAGALTNKMVGHFIKDDAEAMHKSIQEQMGSICNDYLMNEEETKELVERLSKKLNGKVLKDMYAAKDREKFVAEMVEPLVEGIVASRPRIEGNLDKAIEEGLAGVLNDIAEEGGANEDSGVLEDNR